MEKRTFDVTNCIVVAGEVHALTTKNDACPKHPSNNPCEMCSLYEYCNDGNRTLCCVFDAAIDEFFYNVGELKDVDQQTLDTIIDYHR